MGKLLRSDFYRLFKSKSFYICTAIAMFLVSGSVFIVDWSYRMMTESDTLSIAMEFPYTDGLSYGLMMFASGDVHLFMAILIAIFVTAEYAHGTMKNAVSKGFSRYQIYLSKVITMTTAIYIMIFMMFIIGTISVMIITGKFGTLTGTYVGQIFAMIGVEFLLHSALAALFVMIANTVRNNGGAISINIVIALPIVGPLLYQALELIFRNKVSFSEYGLRYNISLFVQNIAPIGEDMLRAVIVGAAFLVVTTAIGIFAFKNMDVK
jgi:ABC-2 type transport system permease protein